MCVGPKSFHFVLEFKFEVETMINGLVPTKVFNLLVSFFPLTGFYVLNGIVVLVLF